MSKDVADSIKLNNIIDFFFDEYYEKNDELNYYIPEHDPEFDERKTEFPEEWESSRGYDFKFWDFWEKLKNTLTVEFTSETRCLISYNLPLTHGSNISVLYLLRVGNRCFFYQHPAGLGPTVFEDQISTDESTPFSAEDIICYLHEDDFPWIVPFSLEVDEEYVKIGDVVQHIGKYVKEWERLIIELQCSESVKIEERLSQEEIKFLKNLDSGSSSLSRDKKNKIKEIYLKCLPA